VSNTVFLETAWRIGRRLCRDAVWADGRCNWLGWTMEARGGQWVNSYRAMPAQVYDGTAGIGLFLVRVAELTQDPIVRTTAEGALAQALTAVDGFAASGEYGFYAGLGGLAWFCAEAGRLLDHAELQERGYAAMQVVAHLPLHPQRLDIINGSAGLIPILLDAASDTGPEMLDAAVRHGEHLLAVATRTDDGWSWDTLGMPNERNLTGFAHGTAGIACALAALGIATDRADFLVAAQEALRYERSLFRPAEGNWPDLRSFVPPGPNGQPPCMLAWCHGAPGIGLGRLQLHQLLPDDATILTEADTAIRTTAATLCQGASGVGNFSLCHGDAGNAELLVVAADVLMDRPDLHRQAETVGEQAIERFENPRMPWPCGLAGAGETPNLLLGLAGMGYFFLRLHDSRAVPTVLLPAARVLPG
jgi:lantibiotic modifying enzyme